MCDLSVEEEKTAPLRSFGSPAWQPSRASQHPREPDPAPAAPVRAWNSGPPATEPWRTGPRQPGQPPGPPAPSPAPMAVPLRQPAVAERPRALQPPEELKPPPAPRAQCPDPPARSWGGPARGQLGGAMREAPGTASGVDPFLLSNSTAMNTEQQHSRLGRNGSKPKNSPTLGSTSYRGTEGWGCLRWQQAGSWACDPLAIKMRVWATKRQF